MTVIAIVAQTSVNHPGSHKSYDTIPTIYEAVRSYFPATVKRMSNHLPSEGKTLKNTVQKSFIFSDQRQVLFYSIGVIFEKPKTVAIYDDLTVLITWHSSFGLVGKFLREVTLAFTNKEIEL